ncbi:MAG: hypothetical protein AAF585_09160 [Verrucomicrobiota bacterium]
MRRSRHQRLRPLGFSTMEMMVTVSILTIMLLLLAEALDPAMRLWGEGEQRIEKYQSARAALELITREMTPAVVDTRMQFVVMPSQLLEDEVGVKNLAKEAPAFFWMAPLGERNRLHCVGYYLARDDDRKRYRLKRLFVPPHPPHDPYEIHPSYPRMMNNAENRGEQNRTSPVNADWFLANWEPKQFDDQDPQNDEVIVGTVADGVIAMWVQCYDLLGNPIPWVSKSKVHPKSELIYNSAGFFYAATSEEFEENDTFVYAAQHELSMKANRVPAAVEIKIYTIDHQQLLRDVEVPEMENIMKDDCLDLEESVKQFEEKLTAAGIDGVESFSTRVKLLNGS